MSLADPLDGFTVRPYQEKDFDAVVGLWTARGMVTWYNDPRRDIDLWVASENAEILVGESAGRIIATLCVGHDGHRGYFYYLATDPDLQRRGLGRRMVAEGEHWLKERKVPKVQLFVRPTNEQANGFYEHLGYEINPCKIWQRWLIERGAPPAEGDAKGKLEVTITFMEMTERHASGLHPHPSGQSYALLRAERMPLSFYRYLYDAVGREWVWYERRLLSDEELAAVIHHEAVEVYVLYVDGSPAGFFELDGRKPGIVNLSLFGLMPDFVGRGLGAWLLASALDLAWDKLPQSVTVDTCTLDHPKALPLYQRMGFVPVLRKTKVIEDPRETGVIPPR
ncbi:GNAT family acetyltransferase [Limibacillus halophilus]|jgi:ribosomal protein S18 acetylase RimI-like enzyme